MYVGVLLANKLNNSVLTTLCSDFNFTTTSFPFTGILLYNSYFF